MLMRVKISGAVSWQLDGAATETKQRGNGADAVMTSACVIDENLSRAERSIGAMGLGCALIGAGRLTGFCSMCGSG